MSLNDYGFEIIHNFLSATCIERIHAEIDQYSEHSAAGLRHAEQKISSIGELISSADALALAKHYLQAEPQFVRCILFDKTVNNNWLVTWHQDKTLCTPEKFERDGWHPWSIKDGAHHVQPPITALNRMLTLRIHLDNTTTENGCLRVIPESHQLGILSSEQIQQVSTSKKAVDCCAVAGSVLAMKPLLLHASSKATTPNRRRIVHVEYIDPAVLER